MGITRRLFRYGCFCVGLYLATLLGVVAFTAFWTNPKNPSADVIVCLGAGMDADGTLHASARKRVETCAILYESGAAPRVHFTGGRRVPSGPGAGDQMAEYAITLGVPDAAITRENESLSTLQNALFSQPDLANAGRILLVTEAFHLPRSAASFWILGGHSVSLYMSEPVRLDRDGRWEWRMIRREAAAIWFNGIRLLGWYGAGFTGMENRDALLD